MYGIRGGGRFMFNRFGEEIDSLNISSSTATLSNELVNLAKPELDSFVRHGIEEMKRLLKLVPDINRYNDLKTKLDKIEDAINLTDTYVSFKNRRLVAVGNAIDNKDVVNKEQLDSTIATIKRIANIFDISKTGLVNIRGHRRIGAVSKSKELYDVVVREELSELKNLLYKYQEELNVILVRVQDDVERLKLSSQREPGFISDHNAITENQGEGTALYD